MLAEVPAPMWNEPVDEEDALDAQPQLRRQLGERDRFVEPAGPDASARGL